jgi:hypothetical protein
MNRTVSNTPLGWIGMDGFLTKLEPEVLNIVHHSLRKKVASLDEDNWMFEPENDARL